MRVRCRRIKWVWEGLEIYAIFPFSFFFVRIRDVFLISCITISFFLRVKFSTLTFIGGEKEWFQSIVKKY